jgi:hypothetical protein
MITTWLRTHQSHARILPHSARVCTRHTDLTLASNTDAAEAALLVRARSAVCHAVHEHVQQLVACLILSRLEACARSPAGLSAHLLQWLCQRVVDSQGAHTYAQQHGLQVSLQHVRRILLHFLYTLCSVQCIEACGHSHVCQGEVSGSCGYQSAAPIDSSVLHKAARAAARIEASLR